MCVSLCFSFSFSFSFRVEAKQTSLEGVVEPMVEAKENILMMFSLFLNDIAPLRNETLFCP